MKEFIIKSGRTLAALSFWGGALCFVGETAIYFLDEQIIGKWEALIRIVVAMLAFPIGGAFWPFYSFNEKMQKELESINHTQSLILLKIYEEELNVEEEKSDD